LLVMSLFAPEGRSDEQPPPKPPELKVLERFAGTWNSTSHSKVAEWTPKETKTTGAATSAWILGGRFLQAKGTDSLPNEFIAQWTYDVHMKAYRMWYFDSLGAA